MSRERARRQRRSPEQAHEARSKKIGSSVAAWALTAVLMGSALLVDPSAEAAFDAPKRLLAMFGVAVAALAAFLPRSGGAEPYLRWSAAQARIAQCVLGAALLTVASALLSPRRAAALDSLRPMFVYALLLPLGASVTLEGRRARWPVAGFLIACVVNAVISLLQSADLYQPVALEAVTGRTSTGALLGNEGHLALFLTLGGLVAFAAALFAGRGTILRYVAAVSALILGAGMVVNLNFTALLATLAGTLVLLGSRYRRKAVLPAILVALGLTVVVAIYPPFRERVQKIAGHVREGEWNDVLTNRVGPWAAAMEMGLERPLLGWGPGTFQAEFVRHRLKAELRLKQRLLIPRITSTFGESHCDYLQAFAELGLPAAVAFVYALVLLVGGLLRRAPSPEASVILAVLSAGLIAAMTWFPLQQPSVAPVLLLAAGRGWRLL